MLVGGEWVEGSGPTLDVLNPATGDTIAQVASASEQDVDIAVRAAQTAYEQIWSKTTPKDRATCLLQLASAIEANAKELARIDSTNVGKPYAPTLSEELPLMVDELQFFAGAARLLDGRAAGEYMSGFTSYLRREPLGVVGSIAPWNYPLLMAIWKIGPALAAGNTVVLKPSEWTPLSALRLGELAADILPPGVLNVVTGEGSPAGVGLVRHPLVRMVSLTGDVSTGQDVAREASSTLKRVHLELGGKAPVIVFKDADLADAVEWIKGSGFFNAGQDCTAAARVLVAQEVYDNFLGELVPAVESIVVAAQDDPAAEMGPVVSAQHLARVAGFVDRAKAEGAKIATGGTSPDRPGFWYQPTVVLPASQQAEIVQREVFGPVITVQPFDGYDQAIHYANDVPYGLSSSVWTADHKRAMNASRDLQFGTVWLNVHLNLVSEMPHGGFKASGYGKDLSIYSMEEYTQIKHVMSALE